MLAALPQRHRSTLRFIAELAGDVARHSSSNKMTMQNLAVVFGPNICRGGDASPTQALQDAGKINVLTQFLFEHEEVLR